MNQTSFVPAVFFCFLTLTGLLPAHHSWILHNPGQNRVEVGHGHAFPLSEQAMNAARIKVTVLRADGNSVSHIPGKDTACLTVPLTKGLTALSGAVFIEEPLIMTRTTKGVKNAPMNTLTGVVDSFRRHRSGVYMSAPGQVIPNLGPHVLLTCRHDHDDLILVLRSGSVPMPEATIEVCEPGLDGERRIGITDAKGHLRFRRQHPGLHLFSAHRALKTTSDETRRDEYTATLVVKLD
jgi:hypothetical protein